LADLPSGTVTFLFTDIEGSTKRWQLDAAAMTDAVDRHLSLLRDAIQRSGGVPFKTVGDAIQAAFPTAPLALQAAVAAQRALLTESWPEPLQPFRVRMALHAGEATPRNGDYLAPMLNRLARLLGVSHGGQILVSSAVCGLLRDQKLPDITLRFLGEQQLRDLLEPEQVWQVVAPGLPEDFPSLTSSGTPTPQNLPIPATPLIGREAEIATVLRLFDEGTRLVTVTGAGGTGKTRLALAAAAELLDDFSGGAWFLDLAALTEPPLLLPQIAAVVGVRESGEAPLAEQLARHFADQRTLLVLDNLEQFRPANELARTVGNLLSAAPTLAILATSRAPLRLRQERELPLAPLPVPSPRENTVDALQASPSVQLFVTRAQAARPGFTLGPQNAAAVAELCRRLDGLPLALELAAARIRALAPADILNRLGNRLELLADPRSDRPDRQRTLEATVAWSYDLLTPDEQIAFCRLAVFAGGFTLAAADAVLAGVAGSSLDGLDAVTALVEQGLLRDQEQPDATLRYRMLTTVRLFGLEQLAASGEEDAARDAHASYFRTLLQRATPETGDGWDESTWLDCLEVERGNLRATLERVADVGTPEELLQVVVSCWDLWWPRGYWTEARTWLERALSDDGELAAVDCAQGLRFLGLVTDALGDHDRGVALVEESRQRFQELGDRRGEWESLLDLSQIWSSRDYEEAGHYAEFALAVARDGGTPVMVAHSLNRLGNWHLNIAQPVEAIRYHEEALTIFKRLRHQRGLAETLDLLGLASGLHGDMDQSVAYFEQSVPLFKALGDRHSLVSALTMPAQSSEGYFSDTLPPTATTLTDALEKLNSAQEIAREIGYRAGEAYTFLVRAGLLGPRGDFCGALTSLRQGLALAEEIGHREWIVCSHCGFGAVHRDLLAFPIARQHLEQALPLAEAIGSPFWFRCVSGFLATVCVAAGDLDRAEAVLAPLSNTDEQLQTLGDRLCQCARVELALARGKPDLALAILDRLIASVPLSSATRIAPRLWYLRGQALAALDRVDEAGETFREAATAAAAHDRLPLFWRIKLAQASLARSQGYSDKGEQAMIEAQKIVQDLATSIPDATLRGGFLEGATRLMQE
jgi:predicted ATPase/class 3 adenylate cyclase